MGFIPEITCRRCGSKYSGMRNRCPKCGAPRTNQPTRVPPTTASAMPETAAYDRSAANVRWQLIFGGVLLIAVILAVIVLVVTGGGGQASTSTTTPGSQVSQGDQQQGSVITDVYLPTPSPSPEPTPEATPTPMVQSMALSFLGEVVKGDLTMSNEGELQMQLVCNIFPANDDAVVTWRSSNETVLTVDQTGLVTIVGVSPGQVVHATIIAECSGVQAYVTIYVPGRHAPYLQENLYDPEYVDEWDLQQAQATATPSTTTTE